MRTLEQVRATMPRYPIEVEFPNVACWQKGNVGIDYVHSFDSGVVGAHVMVMALTHGNEVSGAVVVDHLLRRGLRPRKGRLTLAFANVEAYQRFDSRDPDAARFVDEDLNRVWSETRLNGRDESKELRRARSLRPLIDQVDFLLDLHSMHEEAPPLLLSGPLAKGIRFASEVGAPEHVVVDVGHANGKRLRDYGGFGDPDSAKNALLVETGQHFSKRSQRVAMDVTARFLLQTGVLALTEVAELLAPSPAPVQCILKVTHAVVAHSMAFEFVQDYRGMELIRHAGTLIAREGEREITTPYDHCVLVMPSLRHLSPGVTVVRLATTHSLTETQ
jgi:hypothetical protein